MTPTTILETDSHVLLSLEDYIRYYEAEKAVSKRKSVIIAKGYDCIARWMCIEDDEAMKEMANRIKELEEEKRGLSLKYDRASNRVTQLEVQLGIHPSQKR